MNQTSSFSCKLTNLLSLSLVMLCLGGLYAYSNYVPEFSRLYHYSQIQLQTVFGSAIAIFALTSLFAPALLARLGHRHAFVLAAILFGSGYVVAGMVSRHFFYLWLGFSLISGVGSGIGYICAMYSCMQTGFSRVGLAVGVTVASFGAGAILHSNLIEMLLRGGLPAASIIAWIGIGCGCLMMIAAALVRVKLTGEPVKFAQMIRCVRRHRPLLLISVAAMVLGVFPGLTLLGGLKVLALNIDSQTVVLLCVPFFAIGNLSGRLVSGWLFDRLRVKGIILLIVPLLSLLYSSLLLTTGHIVSGYLSAVLVAALAYGFNFAFFPLYLRHLSDEDSARLLYPIVFFAQGSSALLSGPITGICLESAIHPQYSIAALGGGIAIFGLLLAFYASRREWHIRRSSAEA